MWNVPVKIVILIICTLFLAFVIGSVYYITHLHITDKPGMIYQLEDDEKIQEKEAEEHQVIVNK